MPKVICITRNASEDIDGVKFTKTEAGMVSEEVSDEKAARFASIPGFSLFEEGQSTQPSTVSAPVKTAPPPAATAPVAPPPAADAASTPAATDAPKTDAKKDDAGADDKLAQLREEATKLGIKVKGTWGDKRLENEIKMAKDKAASSADDTPKGDEPTGDDPAPKTDEPF